MAREVRGADGRLWTLRSRWELREPAVGDEFEHEVTGGITPIVFLVVALLALLLMLAAASPARLFLPSWVILTLGLLVLFFPARWLLLRPWTVVAETEGDGTPQGAERWVGSVRGPLRCRNEMGYTARNIRSYSVPGTGESPMQLVE